MHNLSQTLLDAFRKLPVAIIVAIMTLAPASPVLLAEAPENFGNKDVILDSSSEEEMAIQAAKIDAYFGKYNLPLAGQGKYFVAAAKENDLPWSLVAAISMKETTGGKFACKNPKAKNNPFGWGSCKDGFEFDSWKDAIFTVSAHLGGNQESTNHHYEGKSVKEILQKYNPPSVVPDYAPRVMKIMEMIENQEL